MGLLISFFLLSIVVSFLCSTWEAVLLSISPSYIKRKEREDPATGRLLKQLKEDIDTPLSAILTLNTIAHTVGAIGVGAQAGKIYGENFFSLFGWHLSYESIIAALMTLAILILSEIIPKTIGANKWKALGPFTARSLKALVWILGPFVWMSKLITRGLNTDENKSVFSRRDFAAMADVVSETGQIEESDHKLIKNVLAFDELKAEDVMTPRTVMVTAEESRKISDLYGDERMLSFSRIPLYRENPDTITGMVLKDVLLMAMVEGQGDKPLSSIKRAVTIVPDGMPLRKIFQTLSERNEHLAVVVDEYGGLRGLVSLEDIFETLFGLEIMDESDSVGDLRAYARERWEGRAKKLGLID